MALPTSYLITTKNLETFLNATVTAQAPEKFTNKFLVDLDFKSTNDRLFIGIFKSLGMIDENSAPTEIYFQFLDQTLSKQVLAERIKQAYADLFAVNVNAQNMTYEEVKNKFKTLTQGQKSDKVVGLMASTFKALTDYAEWKKQVKPPKRPSEKRKEAETSPKDELGIDKKIRPHKPKKAEFHYNIQIHLPPTRDSSVYDALFKSLKEHLL